MAANKAPLAIAFNVPPAGAIAASASRGIDLPEVYYGTLKGVERAESFSIAGISALDQLQQTLDGLTKAIAQGQSFEQWKRDTLTAPDVAALPNHRLDNIFRTNIQGAYARGKCVHIEVHKKARPYITYSAINDARTRPAHAAMNGFTAAIDDPIWNSWTPPCGYRSGMPWQRVSGHAYVGLKAWYSGPIVEIVGETGARIAVTAQHPILTSRGWVHSQDLRKGDQLVRYADPVGNDATSAHLHEDDPPPTLEEVFNALGTRARGTVPRSTLNLHGDEQFMQGEVDIVATDRKLLDRVIAFEAERIGKFDFASADKGQVLLSGLRALFVVARNQLRRIARTLVGDVARLGWAPAINDHPIAFEKVGQALAVDMQFGFERPERLTGAIGITDRIWNLLSPSRFLASHIRLGNQGEDFRFGPLGNTAFADIFVGGFEVNPNALADLLQAHPGAIEFENVVDLVTRNWSGHVYDLETASGNIMAYGGTGRHHYCISNCRCTLISATKSQGEARAQADAERLQGNPEAKQARAGAIASGPDKGWDYSPCDADKPGVSTGLDKALQDAAANLHPALRAKLDGIRTEASAIKAAEDFTSWSRVAEQQGTTPGGIYLDPLGQKWYVKQYADPMQARTEAAAQGVYGAASVATPTIKLMAGSDGAVYVARLWETLTVPAASQLATDWAPELANIYAVSALVANDDVIGMVGNNLARTESGKLLVVDAGGSMTFTGVGGAKAFPGDRVDELQFLLDPKTPAGQVFGLLTQGQRDQAIKRLSKVSQADIRAAISAGHFNQEDLARLSDIIWQRMNIMLATLNK